MKNLFKLTIRVLLMFVMTLQMSVHAADRITLSDVGTTTDKISTQLEWQKIVPGKNINNQGDASFKVFLVVDTSPVKGKEGKLILKLRSVLPFELKWNVTGGAFNSRIEAKQNELVLWQGIMLESSFKDSYTTNMTMDGRYLNTVQQLNFVIEWESK